MPRKLLAVATVAICIGFPVGAQASPAETATGAQPNGRVSAIALDPANRVVYIGGSFTSVKDRSVSKPRNRLAAIDADTGALLDWAPGANNEVLALALANGTVFIGGNFTSVTGTSGTAAARSRLAAIDAATGTVTDWNPGANKTVNALSASPTRLYVGGAFTTVSGQSRSRLAAFSSGTNPAAPDLDPSWAPAANATVSAVTYALAAAERVYVGGQFTAVNGQPRPYGVALTPDNGDLDQTFESPEYPILDFAADTLGSYGGGAGHGGHLVIWNPDGSIRRTYQTDGDVQAVTAHGGEVVAGGHFGNYCVGDTGAGAPFICDNPLPRKKLMSVDADGEVTNWNPMANKPFGVLSLGADDVTGAVYAGGDFTTINGKPQAHYAQFVPVAP